jgi:hypothetical protein
VGFRAFSIQALTEIRVPHPSERSAAESKNLLLDPLRKGWETTEAHLDRKDSGRKRASSGGTLFARCPILGSHPEPGAAQKLVVILSEVECLPAVAGICGCFPRTCHPRDTNS